MQKPHLRLIQRSRGIDEAIIFLNGYQSKYESDEKLWTESLNCAGWQGAIYHLWWDAGSEYGRKYAMSPLGVIPVINEVAHSYPHWRMVLKRAESTGFRYFPSLLSSISEPIASVIGYSLGGRVIHYGMKKFQPWKAQTTVKDLILVAGAIRTIEWEVIADKITGNIHNFYNRQDKTLNDEFSLYGLYKYQPCGIHPIKTQCKNIRNHNLTRVINTSSHDLKTYLRSLPRYELFD